MGCWQSHPFAERHPQKTLLRWWWMLTWWSITEEAVLHVSESKVFRSLVDDDQYLELKLITDLQSIQWLKNLRSNTFRVDRLDWHAGEGRGGTLWEWGVEHANGDVTWKWHHIGNALGLGNTHKPQSFLKNHSVAEWCCWQWWCLFCMMSASTLCLGVGFFQCWPIGQQQEGS